jgi:hypothetical protein
VRAVLVPHRIVVSRPNVNCDGSRPHEQRRRRQQGQRSAIVAKLRGSSHAADRDRIGECTSGEPAVGGRSAPLLARVCTSAPLSSRWRWSAARANALVRDLPVSCWEERRHLSLAARADVCLNVTSPPVWIARFALGAS